MTATTCPDKRWGHGSLPRSDYDSTAPGSATLSCGIHKSRDGNPHGAAGARVTLFGCTQKIATRSSLINIATSSTSKTMLPTSRLLPTDEFIFRGASILS
jgi:hypothetical protein